MYMILRVARPFFRFRCEDSRKNSSMDQPSDSPGLAHTNHRILKPHFSCFAARTLPFGRTPPHCRDQRELGLDQPYPSDQIEPPRAALPLLEWLLLPTPCAFPGGSEWRRPLFRSLNANASAFSHDGEVPKSGSAHRGFGR